MVNDFEFYDPGLGEPYIQANNGSKDLLNLSKAYDFSLFLSFNTFTYEKKHDWLTINLIYLINL